MTPNESPAALLPDEAESLLRRAMDVCIQVVKRGEHAAHNAAVLNNAIERYMATPIQPATPGSSESRGSVPVNPRCGAERYELDAYIWRRDSTQEWVLELSGTINDCFFVSRHAEPLTTKPEDVAGLPSLYAAPTPPAVSNGEPPDWAIVEAVFQHFGSNRETENASCDCDHCKIIRHARELARSAAAKGEG